MNTICKIAIAAAFITFVGYASATPFLVCDPYPVTGPQPTSFSCAFDNGALVSFPPAVNTDGSVQIHYDIASLAVGAHSVQCSASNVYGSSALSPKFAWFAGIPSAPADSAVSAK